MVKKIIFFIEALLLGFILWIIELLPVIFISNLCGGIARFLGPFLKKSDIALQNLKYAFPEKTEKEHKKILKDMWENLGRNIAEFPHLKDLKPTLSGAGYEVVGENYLKDLACTGGPALFFSGHIANWEVLPLIVHTYGIKMSSFYRAPSNPWVSQLVSQKRSKHLGGDIQNFPKGNEGSKNAFHHLKQKGYLGILIDQKLDEGIWIPFFNQEAKTTTSLAVFALRFKCPIIPGYIERIAPARFRLVVEKPLGDVVENLEKEEKEKKIYEITLHTTEILEEWIKKIPGSWLWIHRRWPKELYK